jgi:hypothetical protein
MMALGTGGLRFPQPLPAPGSGMHLFELTGRRPHNRRMGAKNRPAVPYLRSAANFGKSLIGESTLFKVGV